MGYSPWNRKHSDPHTQTHYHPMKIENILLTIILSFGGGGCAGFSVVVMSVDYSPVVVCRPLIVVPSLVVEHGL